MAPKVVQLGREGAMYRQEEPEVNWDQIAERIRGFLGRFRLAGGGGRSALAVIAILAVAAVGWVGTGFYTVQPGEQGALRRFGKFDTVTGPGLHWFWPAPIGTRNVVNVEQLRTLEIGFRGATPVLAEALMITGDENLVDVQLVVQFDIQRSITDETGRLRSPLELYLFESVDPAGSIIKSASESALRQVVGQRNIDDVLTVLKEDVQAETKELLQRLLDSYHTGIRVREVKLQNVRAPSQVQDAFDDVVRAKEDKERIIRLAEAYEADILPRALGGATRTVQAAEAFKAERVAIATGEASRFLQILREFRLAEEVTRQRLFLEAMEEILANVNIFVVDSGAGGNLLQFLPLTGSSP